MSDVVDNRSKISKKRVLAWQRSTSRRNQPDERIKLQERIQGGPGRNRFGNFCLILQALISVAFMGVVILLNMLPMRYLVLVGLVLLFLWCITLTSQALRRRRGVIGKAYSLLGDPAFFP